MLKKHFRSGASKAGANTMIHQVKAACLSPEEHFLKTVKERRLLEEINRLDENLQEIVSLRIYENRHAHRQNRKRCQGGGSQGEGQASARNGGV